MFFTKSWEDSTHTNEKKLKELAAEFASLNKDVENFFSEWNLSEDTIAEYNQLQSQFSEEAWQKLNEERLKLEAKLKRELNLVRNPLEAKKRYQERNVAPHWLFVR